MENTLHNTNRINNLFRSYLDKSISPSDRYELEKIALDDDFLFEALEGYTDSNIKTVPMLKYKAVTHSPAAKTFSLRPVLSIAASLLLIAAVVAFFYLKNANVTEKQQIAQLLAESNDSTEENTEQIEEPVIAADDKTDNSLKKEETIPQTTVANGNKNEKVVAQKETKPVSAETEEVAVVPVAKASKPDYTKETSTLNKSIVLGDNSKETMAISNASDQPYPEIGFEKLRDNIRNSRIRQRAFMLRCKGDIEMHFTINREGNPESFKVKESHCPPCEELLEELLRSSGKWIVPPNAPNREAAYIYRIQ